MASFKSKPATTKEQTKKNNYSNYEQRSYDNLENLYTNNI